MLLSGWFHNKANIHSVHKRPVTQHNTVRSLLRWKQTGISLNISNFSTKSTLHSLLSPATQLVKILQHFHQSHITEITTLIPEVWNQYSPQTNGIFANAFRHSFANFTLQGTVGAHYIEREQQMKHSTWHTQIPKCIKVIQICEWQHNALK